MFAPMILDFLGCQVERNIYSNKKILLASMKALKNSEKNSESRVRNALRLPTVSLSLVGFSPKSMSHWMLNIFRQDVNILGGSGNNF